MWVVVLFLVTLLVVKISHWVYTWANPKCNGKLPPGSMGLPIIGESLEYLSPHTSFDIPPFFRKRTTRYGPVFKTSVFGMKMVVSVDPDINYSFLQKENTNLLFWITKGLSQQLGEENLLTQHGSIHKYMKNLFLTCVGPESLRTQFLHEMDETTRRYLQSWADHGTVDVKEAISQMIFETFAKKLFSYDEAKDSKKLFEYYKTFADGFISFPLNIPGTAFHASLQATKKAVKVIKEIYEGRKASKVRRYDFLDRLIEEVEKDDAFMNDEVAVNLLFLFLFGAFETSSQSITLLVNFLYYHPNVLTELTKEHEVILRSRDNKNSGVTWEEYKSMNFTHMAINENIRLANIIPAVSRKVRQDIEIKGYTIPKGWMFVAVPSFVHLNPDIYEDPLTFNPWRWKGRDLHAGSKTFMAFGSGVRLCAGAEFSKLQTAILLHYLVTKYRWSVIKGGDFKRKPVLIFPNGLHIEIEEKREVVIN